MAEPHSIISREEDAELQRLHEDYAVATKRASDALRANDGPLPRRGRKSRGHCPTHKGNPRNYRQALERVNSSHDTRRDTVEPEALVGSNPVASACSCLNSSDKRSTARTNFRLYVACNIVN
jgi:hypothetical protein